MHHEAFEIIFPADSDTLGLAAEFEAESRALVAKANSLATIASESRGEYRVILEEKIQKLLYDAVASYHPGTYLGGCAPYIKKGAKA